MPLDGSETLEQLEELLEDALEMARELAEDRLLRAYFALESSRTRS